MADVVWATNSPEFYGLLVSERGWTPEQYEAWLADSWAGLFIVSQRVAQHLSLRKAIESNRHCQKVPLSEATCRR